MATMVSVVTVIVLFGTLLVVAWQTHIFTRQATIAAEQAAIAARQADIAQATAETSFNLAIMERLDRVLLEVADRPLVRRRVWKRDATCPQDNGAVQVLTQSLIDVLELSLMAVERLPGFALNGDDWRAYFDEVYATSGCVRHELGSKPGWWPYCDRHLAACSTDGIA